ncbi:MAG: hypothetical protein JWN92_3060 [Candidatus Acidoferrum typicum]|nr:hypothetical protein [Candidatus Acidoferrum typicum]
MELLRKNPTLKIAKLGSSLGGDVRVLERDRASERLGRARPGICAPAISRTPQ